MPDSAVLYNVVCRVCGRIWTPAADTSLWWRSYKREQKGYIDALHVSAEECGCKVEVEKPDAPYRVMGHDDLDGSSFDIPFSSLVDAARRYLKIGREGMYTVLFIDKRLSASMERSKVQMLLEEMVWR